MNRNDSPIVAASVPRSADRGASDVRRRASMWVLVGTAIAAVGVDQLTKAVAVAALGSGPAHIGVLHLRLVANRGLLMGILPAPLVVVAAATLLVVWFAVRAGRTGAIRTSIAFGLLAGGALGNFVDRILERQAFPGNAVVDWLSFGGMTFNLADVALLVGALMLVFGHESVPDKPTV